jgi:hypothetical protein
MTLKPWVMRPVVMLVAAALVLVFLPVERVFASEVAPETKSETLSGVPAERSEVVEAPPLEDEPAEAEEVAPLLDAGPDAAPEAAPDEDGEPAEAPDDGDAAEGDGAADEGVEGAEAPAEAENRAAYVYGGPLAEALGRFKYRGASHLAPLLSGMLTDAARPLAAGTRCARSARARTCAHAAVRSPGRPSVFRQGWRRQVRS